MFDDFKTNAQRFAESIRLLADFYDANPNLEPPVCWDRHWVDLYSSNKEQLMLFAKALGSFEKGADGMQFFISKRFGSLDFQVRLIRNAVCQAKVVGKRTVVKKVPATFIEETVEEDIIEWECPKSLLKVENQGKEIEQTVEADDELLLF